MSTRGLAIGALVCGLAVLALSGAFISMHLRSVKPLNGAYGDQAILAFELARTPEELAAVIGSDPPDAGALAVRAAMDRANRLDFLYMSAYGLFIALSFCAAGRARGQRWLPLAAALGPLAALCDVAENRVLLDLTQPGANVGALLPALHARTLAKWELLALAAALFAAGVAVQSRLPARMAGGALAIFALGAGAMTIVNPAIYLPLLSLAIVLAWLWQLGDSARIALASK